MKRFAAALVLGLVLCIPSAVAAQEPGTTTTTVYVTTTSPDPQGIIPLPNTGHPPTEAGDRGGALQYLVLALMAVGIGTIAALVVRESRKVRRGSVRT